MTRAVYSWIGQVVGAIAGAAIIFGIASGKDGFERGQFAANLWTPPYFGLGSTIVVEVLLTALLVLVVLFTTTKKFAPGMGGLVIGLTLTTIHLISIPVDNTSVNPVRSLATALFADPDTEALQQLWAFIVFPLIGAVLGVIIWLMLDDSRLEDTELVELPGASDCATSSATCRRASTTSATEPPSGYLISANSSARRFGPSSVRRTIVAVLPHGQHAGADVGILDHRIRRRQQVERAEERATPPDRAQRRQQPISETRA
jgi:hypothetical protein